jgi:hypothetical protein
MRLALRLLPATLVTAALAAAPAQARPIGNVCVPEVDIPMWCGDGGPARHAGLVGPFALTRADDGAVLIVDTALSFGTWFVVVRRVGRDGVISTVAGRGPNGFSGDGGPALDATIPAYPDIAALPDGSFLITDEWRGRVRRVTPGGVITTVAGTGVLGHAGDGGPATSAQLARPTAVAADIDGGFLIADSGDGSVRRVAPDGIITTVAQVAIDPATRTDGPFFNDLAVFADGRIVFASPTAIATLDRAGAATPLVDAVASGLGAPVAIAPLAGGGLAFAEDGGTVRERAVDGRQRRLAGFVGRNCVLPRRIDPAFRLRSQTPTGLAALPDGSLLVAYYLQARVRRIAPTGAVNTFAGGVGSRETGRCFPHAPQQECRARRSIGCLRDIPDDPRHSDDFSGDEFRVDDWAAFTLLSARLTRRAATVELVSTLPARVTVTLKGPGGTKPLPPRTIRAGKTKLAFGVRLAAGEFDVSIAGTSVGRAKGLKRRDGPIDIRVAR